MTLGVTVTGTMALLSVVENGAVSEAPVYRTQFSALAEASAELDATLDEIGRVLAQLKPNLVVLLLPEQTPHFKQTYAQLAPRVTLEVLFRLAAVRALVPIDLMARPTVRSRLGLPQSGDLASHTQRCFDVGIGPYWNAGRNVAALAALAGEVS
jgi:hypothetical protein